MLLTFDNANSFVHILAVYSVIHILYTDLGLEFDSKYARVIKHPAIVFLLTSSLAYAEMEQDIYKTLIVLGIFYGSRYIFRNLRDDVFDAMFPSE